MEQFSFLNYLPVLIILAITWMIGVWIKKISKNYPPSSTEKNSLSGVGGWLLLLTLQLMILGPLLDAGRINFSFISMENEFPNLKTIPNWSIYKNWVWFVMGLKFLIGFYAGLKLIKDRNPSAINQVKVIIWITGPVAGLILGVFLPEIIFGSVQIGSEFIGPFLSLTITCIVWTIYLSKSNRVKATYGTK